MERPHWWRDGALKVVSLNPADPSRQTLALDSLRVPIDPSAERREMFDQAWRLDQDLFWDPRMNGVNWPLMRQRYLPLASRARSHEDMIYVLGELQGELGTSHMFVGGGDAGDPRPPASTALLGVDFALDASSGRFRMARIYRGDASRERFRAPFGDPHWACRREASCLRWTSWRSTRPPTRIVCSPTGMVPCA